MSTLPRVRNVHAGRLLLGLALAALGVLWLLQALDVATIDWKVGLPIAVIGVGTALVAAGYVGRGSGGLVILGISLTALLLVSTVVEVPLGGGVGDRTYRPSVLQGRTYELAIGRLTIDLTKAGLRTPFQPAAARLTAHVGVGQLLVLVPSAFEAVAVHAKAGVGDVMVFGRDRGGFGPEYRSPGSGAPAPGLRLELTVGIGQVEVRRG